MTFSQHEFDIRCEWGLEGVEQLAPISDVVIIVDVLSFSTCVDIAVQRGATVYPYHWRDQSAETFAAAVDAELAQPRRQRARYSLSPASLTALPAGMRLVLPSPNGSTLSLATGSTPTLAGCLRNAYAVAMAARDLGRRIAMVPGGERWPNGHLRAAYEDWVGAGAIISHLGGTRSPEAEAAAAAFLAAKSDLGARLRLCGSGRELIERGFEEDVALASALDVSACAPMLVDGAYTYGQVSQDMSQDERRS
jgi:2-phosphosulfolactate phosphatase